MSKVDVEKLKIEVKRNKTLTKTEHNEIIALCTQAFERDYAPFMEMFENPTHVLGRLEDKLVSYVLWITRWLQVGEGPLLRTAYIEGLATVLNHRNKGFASQIMRRVIEEVPGYDIAALATGSHGFYERLGWKVWQGPLYARKDKELVAVPEEHGCVMVYNLPGTPPCDIKDPLSVEWRELEPW